MHSEIKPKGYVKLTLNGQLVAVHNLVLNSGFAGIAARVISDTAPKATQMAIGTGSTAAVATNTALVAELARQPITGSVVVTETVTDDAVQYTATFPAGSGTGSLREAGLVDAANKLWCRTVFPELAKAAGDSLTLTWVVKIGA